MKFINCIKCVLLIFLLYGCSQPQDNVKIGYIEGLSGPFSNIGIAGARHLEMLISEVNEKGGVLGGKKLQLEQFDGKTNPQESLIAFRKLADQNISFFFHGNSSAVAGALNSAVAKHNERNPQSAVLYLNYGAVDPVLTNEKCNFWHFRFDADVDMKMQALTNFMAENKKIRKVYLINQDYSFGHSVVKAAKEMLSQKRPDIKIVGDDLHPIAKVKDFMPYVAKIKASGADTVVSGNWGTDIALLVKAIKDAGLDVDIYSYYAGIMGGPASVGEAGIGRVKQVTGFHNNIGGDSDYLVDKYKSLYPNSKDDFYWISMKHGIALLVQAINQANSLDALLVAKELEKGRYDGPTGEVWMRGDNHQLLQPIYVSSLRKQGEGGVKNDVERTGMGFRTEVRIEAIDTKTETTCNMKKP